MIVEIIIKDLNSALEKLGYSKMDVKVSKCKNPKFGAFSSSIPLALGKIHQKPPMDIANEIRSEMHTGIDDSKEVQKKIFSAISGTLSENRSFNELIRKFLDS